MKYLKYKCYIYLLYLIIFSYFLLFDIKNNINHKEFYMFEFMNCNIFICNLYQRNYNC